MQSIFIYSQYVLIFESVFLKMYLLGKSKEMRVQYTPFIAVSTALSQHIEVMLGNSFCGCCSLLLQSLHNDVVFLASANATR